MLPIFRAARPVRIARNVPAIPYSAQMRSYAQQSYGNVQSGMEQGTNEKNPKVGMEHPGPESPSAAKKGNESSGQTQAKGEGETQSQNQSGSQSETTSHGGRPAIHKPKTPSKGEDPEVRKHNEELENRYERTENQLSEKDQKVNKNFWQGDVGGEKR